MKLKLFILLNIALNNTIFGVTIINRTKSNIKIILNSKQEVPLNVQEFKSFNIEDIVIPTDDKGGICVDPSTLTRGLWIKTSEDDMRHEVPFSNHIQHNLCIVESDGGFRGYDLSQDEMQ